MNEELDYIKNAFTKAENNVNLEVDNLNVGCLTSKNGKFELDSEGNLVVNSITAREGLGSSSNGLTFDQIYPIGSIYMSVSEINPSSLFGGVWERITGRFLLGSGTPEQNNFNSFGTLTNEQLTSWYFHNGEAGGEYQHTLSEGEMPLHGHSMNFSTSESGTHSHQIAATFIGASHNHYYDPGDALSNGSNNGTKYSNSSTIQVAGNHTHAVNGNTNGAGGNLTHNNMPPFLVVNMWKRTA